MKRFIEKLYGRLYGRKFRTGFYFEVMTFTILPFILIVFYSYLSSNQDSYGEYKSYYNIVVEIKDGRINGKLNKYIDLKYKNNICYIENCGFPHEGEFQLSSIQIWEKGRRKYIFKICIDEEKYCFYNITMVRNNLHFDKTNRDAGELGWLFPFGKSGVYGYVKYFTGYGESLIDYNRHTDKVGIGFAILK